MRGRYVVLEGPDGAGKGEQVTRLIPRLERHGLKVVSIYEPGGNTPMGDEIRTLLKNQDLPRHVITNVFLFNAARAEALNTIKSHLEDGDWCVCDRNRLSTFAFQGHGEGADLPMLYSIDEAVHNALGVRPDIEIVLDLPQDVADRRRQGRGTTDYFEELGSSFDRRVNAGYRFEAERLRLPTVDASRSIEQMHETIWRLVLPLVKEVRP